MKKKVVRIIIASILTISFITLNAVISIDKLAQLFVYLAIYLFIAYDILLKAVRNLFSGGIFDENFLMSLASIGAFVISEFAEGVAVVLLYQIGETFQSYAVNKSRKSISSLMDLHTDTVRLVLGDKITEISPYDAKVGDIFEIRRGERIALDGVIINGETYLDTSAITGESIKKHVKKGDKIISGCICDGAVIQIQAETDYENSTVSKIMNLVNYLSDKKSKSENFISKFALFYTPIVCIIAVLLVVIPSIFLGDFNVWLYRGLSFLVVSCPCALVISIPLSFFSGLGSASKNGILIKGSEYLEKLTKANVFVFDKTGTLTKGDFSIVEINSKIDKDTLLKYLAICESKSNHPIASVVKQTVGEISALDYEITELSGKGIIAKSNTETIIAGSLSFLKEQGINCQEIHNDFTNVYVSHNGEFIGVVSFGDVIKDGVKETLKGINSFGGKTILLSGDNERSVKRFAKTVGINTYYHDLLPTDKSAILEKILSEKSKNAIVTFIGDGINDAPSLMLADIGVSMGQIGSDIAIEASDIVLMYDDVSKLILAKRIANKTLSIVKQNVIFSITIKLLALILSGLGLLSIPLAVFADVGVAIIAILNSMRALKIKS